MDGEQTKAIWAELMTQRLLLTQVMGLLAHNTADPAALVADLQRQAETGVQATSFATLDAGTSARLREHMLAVCREFFANLASATRALGLPQ